MYRLGNIPLFPLCVFFSTFSFRFLFVFCFVSFYGGGGFVCLTFLPEQNENLGWERETIGCVFSGPSLASGCFPGRWFSLCRHLSYSSCLCFWIINGHQINGRRQWQLSDSDTEKVMWPGSFQCKFLNKLKESLLDAKKKNFAELLASFLGICVWKQRKASATRRKEFHWQVPNARRFSCLDQFTIFFSWNLNDSQESDNVNAQCC